MSTPTERAKRQALAAASGPITQYASAKEYLEDNKIPQMFQSLIASLMMEKPDNHYNFLDKQLNMIKEVGLDNVNWETFVEHLHPTKDPVRVEHIQDDVSLKIKKRNDPEADLLEPMYKPEVFQLTEATD